jgi:hypothetical protein
MRSALVDQCARQLMYCKGNACFPVHVPPDGDPCGSPLEPSHLRIMELIHDIMVCTNLVRLSSPKGGVNLNATTPIDWVLGCLYWETTV